jgi:serine/threonine protein kinase/Flp pilus assembly protein TadD
MAQNFRQIAEHFEHARSLPVAERAGYLAEACRGDAEMLAELQSLLAHHDDEGHALTEGAARRVVAKAASSILGGGMAPADWAGDTEGLGSVIGRFTLIEKIGEGGFGTVYRAEQSEPVRRQVALKVIKLGMDTRRVVARFEAERQALAVMEHPNIARVFDGGATESGRPYFVMELVDGIPITAYCDEHSLSTKDRLMLFRQVCLAVQHAHLKGIIHRDIKPSNVLVTVQDGEPVPKVIDFGIAKATDTRLGDQTLLTEHGHFVGTPAYMSPEQAAAGQDIDLRTDIYSLGVLLYELLTGQTPFDATRLRSVTVSEMQRIIREQDPPRPSLRLSSYGERLSEVARLRRIDPRGLTRQIRGELDWIVMKALEKDRGRRYESAGAMAEDLRRHLSDEPVLAGPPSALYRFGKLARRHKALIGSAAVALLALLIGLTLALIGFINANQQRHRALRAERDATHQARAAETAQQQAEAVSTFLEDMLTRADPAQTEGRELTLKEVLDEAAGSVGRSGGENSLVQASIRRTIGRTYSMIGRYAEATPHLEAARELYARELGDNEFKTLRSTLDLADNLLLAGNLDDAEPLLVQTVAALRTAEPPMPSLLARSLYSLGRLNKSASDYASAEPLLREAVQLYETSVDEPGPGLRTRGELGTLLSRLAQYDEAEALLRDAVEVARRLYGPRSAHVGGLMNNLAVVLKRNGDFEQAGEVYRESLEIQRATFTNQHPATVATMVNLCQLLVATGKYAEAEPLLREAIPLLEEIHGPDSVQMAIVQSTLSRALSGQGHITQAIEVTRRAIASFQLAVGPNHEYVATALGDLAVLLMAVDDLDNARASLLEAVAIFEGSVGTDHPSVALMHERLATVEYRRGNVTEGDVLFARAVDVYQRRLGPEHLEVARVHQQWAKSLMLVDDHTAAEQRLSEALRICHAAEGGDVHLEFNLSVALGGCLAAQQRFAEAESLLLGLDGLLPDEPAASESYRKALADSIAKLYEAWGKEEQAAQWRAGYRSVESGRME